MTIRTKIETFGIMIRMNSEKVGIKAQGSGIEMNHEGERIEMMIRTEIDETVRAITYKTTSRLGESSAPETRLKLRGLPITEGSMSGARIFAGDREMRPATRKPRRT